jgi:hypothetical protein
MVLNVKPLPETSKALVLRTEFSDDAAWRDVCAAIEAPSPIDGFMANVAFVEDRAFEGSGVDDMLAAHAASGFYRAFMFAVDHTTIANADHPVLVLDLIDTPGRTFRVIPSEMWSVEDNLSLANMDFEDFAESVDAVGIFRGFE